MADNSDQQYASFRDNVPYLFILMIIHPISRRLFEAFSPLSTAAPHTPNSTIGGKSSPDPEYLKADDRLHRRITFDVASSIVFLFALHGFSALKVILILYLNFNIAKHIKREYVPVVTWVFNIAILFANELGQGYPMGKIADMISPWSSSTHSSSDGNLKSNWGTVLDSYGGLVPRWEVLFNVTVLRLISFNIDYCWSLDQIGGSPIEVCKYDSLYMPLRPGLLTATRRSKSILRICLNEIESTYQLNRMTIHFEIT